MSDRCWCSHCGAALQLGQRCGCWPGGQVDLSAAALRRDHAAALDEQARNIPKSPIRPLTYNYPSNSTTPVYFENTSSTLEFAKPKQKENDMNVTADVVPTVGGFRGIVRRTRTNHAEMTNEVVVVWESAKVYKTYEKAKAAAERRIAEGLQAVFG